MSEMTPWQHIFPIQNRVTLWLVVCTDGEAQLLFPFATNETHADRVMREIRLWYWETMRRYSTATSLGMWHRLLIKTEPRLVMISPVPGTVRNVHIHESEANEVLSRGLRYPSTLEGQQFFQVFPSLAETARPQQAISLEYAVNKSMIAYLAVGAMLLCVLVGLIVSIISKNLAYGAACGGVLLTLISITQALILWTLK